MLITILSRKKKSIFLFRSGRTQQWWELIHNFDPFGQRPRRYARKHPFAIRDQRESSDVEKVENIFSSYCTQKKVSRQLWMDQPVEVVKALPYDIDGIKVYNVKADSRLELLEAIKDGRKWKRDSRTDWAGYSSVRYKDCS